jgi:hypothetical protein
MMLVVVLLLLLAFADERATRETMAHDGNC